MMLAILAAVAAPVYQEPSIAQVPSTCSFSTPGQTREGVPCVYTSMFDPMRGYIIFITLSDGSGNKMEFRGTEERNSPPTVIITRARASGPNSSLIPVVGQCVTDRRRYSSCTISIPAASPGNRGPFTFTARFNQ